MYTTDVGAFLLRFFEILYVRLTYDFLCGHTPAFVLAILPYAAFYVLFSLKHRSCHLENLLIFII